MSKSTEHHHDLPYTGSCLCGDVRYQVEKLEPKMGHCHCTMCRKFHGAAFATFGEAKAENFIWLTGEQNLKTFTAENGTRRKFCQNCGSSMVFEASGETSNLVEFSLGTLDSDINEKPDVHIFTAYKANWYEPGNDLPKFTKGRA